MTFIKISKASIYPLLPKNGAGERTGHSGDLSEKGAEMGLGRILDRETFLYLLDMEVKRSRRYPNFFSLLVLKFDQLFGKDNSSGLLNCYNHLTQLMQEEFRESDILGSVGKNRLVALLPFADVSAVGQVRSHFEASLESCGFRKEGYEVRIDQICFPMDGTDTRDLIRKVIGSQTT
jgi:hypothetical protein